MFHTVPTAEIPFLFNLYNNGGRSWRWVELGLQIPYFLAFLRKVVGHDAEIRQQVMLSHLDDVLELASLHDNTLQVTEIWLLSPGYMNGTDTYRLGKIKEIWQGKACRGRHMYVMEDGARLNFEIGDLSQSNDGMELVLDLKAQSTSPGTIA